MYRFLLLAVLAVNGQAKDVANSASPAQISSTNVTATLSQEAPEAAYTELEHNIVELSGLLSLSEQVKVSAQHMVALSADGASESPESVAINHAQHFGIAQSLSKRWNPIAWEQRLLDIVDQIDDKTQALIEKGLSKGTITLAQQKEKAAIAKQGTVEYQQYIDKLKQRPPAASRWQLVEELDQQSGFSPLIIKVRSKVYAAISQQVSGWQPPLDWQKQAQQEVLEFLFYAYRKTPNNELKNTADHYNNPALKILLARVMAGL